MPDIWHGRHRMPFITSWAAKVAAASAGEQTIRFTHLSATAAAIVCNRKLSST